MSKKLSIVLIVAILCSGMLFAANTTGKMTGNIAGGKFSAGENPTLTLNWTLDKTLETFEFGFTDSAVSTKNPVTATPALSLETVKTLDSVTGEANTYVYWQLDTRQPLKISMSGSGPLVSDGGASAETCINWQATFNKVTVDDFGHPQPAPAPTTIGILTDATANTAGTEYTDAKDVFVMGKIAAAQGSQQKYGSAAVAIKTQDASGKTDGAYAAQLILGIAAIN